jgi:hypothetical protein
MARPITSWRFGEMLVESGVITQERLNKTARIVIDAKQGEAVMVYSQEYGDDKSLEKLAPMLEGMLDAD